jgi:AmmeMemoRadiSam system protein A
MQSLPEPSTSVEERHKLLQFARESVQSAVTGSAFIPAPKDELFSRICGAFVTLHVNGKLRGCIGVVEASEPLRESISHCAAGAALHDPRFPPIRAEELNRLEIEISLLSQPAPIQPDQIVLGRHGLIVASERKRGLLLPQVATEHRLDRETFLAETCKKAGLPRDAWKSDSVEILGFTCEVFSDYAEHGAAR